MSKSTKIVFFGNERLATGVRTKAPTLRKLIHKGYKVAAVVSNYSPGVSRQQRSLEIVEVAHAYHIPVLLPEKPEDIIDKLIKIDASAAVLAAYGKIIPKSILGLFPKGILNIHPSLLPKFRGPTPLETVILSGVAQTGVSLMRLEAKMDAGPIFAQETLNLSGQETKQQLADKLSVIGSSLLTDNLDSIIDGKLKARPQDDTKATYTSLLSKKDGFINWNQPPETIERKVRAYEGFPKAQAKINSHDVILTKVRVAKDAIDGSLIIECQGGWVEVLELVAPSGRKVSGSDFQRGYS